MHSADRYVGKFIGNFYGAGSEPIWLDKVQCSGMETDITECRHSDWGSHNCSHNNDVSLSCTAGIAANKYSGKRTGIARISRGWVRGRGQIA